MAQNCKCRLVLGALGDRILLWTVGGCESMSPKQSRILVYYDSVKGKMSSSAADFSFYVVLGLILIARNNVIP